jgi:glucosamine-6-phosphate deaminase
MQLLIYDDYDTVSNKAADHICHAINRHGNHRNPFVLGLPTGSSPLGTYRELVSRHHDGQVSFRSVVTVNMDEYVGIPEGHPQSFHTYMQEHFFKHVDIPRENIHIPNGNASNLENECTRYEAMIRDLGGIDLFLSGVGHDGHIAFNVAGSSLGSRTRVQKLNKQTVTANARFFGQDPGKVPSHALTVGVGTIMDARQVLVVVSGEEKAEALKHGVEEGINHLWTISALQMHPDAIIMCDEPATCRLDQGIVDMLRFLGS